MAPGGRLSLIEIIPSAYWIDTLPSRAIFSVTSSRLLAPLAKRLGANSAGVGVCYVTSSQISSLLATAGLEVESMADFDDYAHPLPVRLGLHARRIRPVLHWVRRREP
jgi:hypothetical protein